ncbi:hypothetical protein DRJ48_01590 [Candidatus Woesearchaeota archaeon]|nr:hypothetical protein [Candidatus Woesearchaeota archaeon]RLE43180.1 MAG: hypothetical protein DRJ48_01590 [Candidatus Woesearchaeota archaeon]
MSKKRVVFRIKRKHLWYLFSLLLIVAIVFGIRAYNIHKHQQELAERVRYYNNFRFEKMAGMWWTQWQRGKDLYTIPFRFLPSEVENVTVTGQLVNFSFGQLYITFNPYDTDLQFVALAASELGISLAKVFHVEIKSACTEPYQNVCPPKPIVTCNNTNQSVIMLRVAENPKITLNKNCITFEGDKFDLVRVVDKFLYYLYGIL